MSVTSDRLVWSLMQSLLRVMPQRLHWTWPSRAGINTTPSDLRQCAPCSLLQQYSTPGVLASSSFLLRFANSFTKASCDILLNCRIMFASAATTMFVGGTACSCSCGGGSFRFPVLLCSGFECKFVMMLVKFWLCAEMGRMSHTENIRKWSQNSIN